MKKPILSERNYIYMTSKRISDKDIVVSGAVPARRKPSAAKRVKRTVAAAAAEAPVTQPITEPRPKAVTQVITAPTQEQVAALAYSYWVARGRQGGSPEQDWLRAEQELAAAAIA
jgi:hypothetical protein